ncbi:MAG: AbrB/MazE/SpoVT family DNA-binding domain-containing protein [Thaumarchaeota archaeon]|nr:AbrB/MazE/SpoVT family DNA-binding domain-containing protein [Nitrososphaerota archaeon]
MAVYIPKDMAERLGLEEGDKMVLQLVDDKLVLTPIKPPRMREAWGEVSMKEVEEVGEELTRKTVERG